MKLSEVIKNYREEHNISIRAFSQKCDLSNGYIGMLEKEKNPCNGEPITPSIRTMMKLANGMGMNLDDLMSQLDDNIVINLNDATTAMSFEEGQLIEYYRALDDKSRRLLMNIAKGMVE